MLCDKILILPLDKYCLHFSFPHLIGSVHFVKRKNQLDLQCTLENFKYSIISSTVKFQVAKHDWGFVVISISIRLRLIEMRNKSKYCSKPRYKSVVIEQMRLFNENKRSGGWTLVQKHIQAQFISWLYFTGKHSTTYFFCCYTYLLSDIKPNSKQ